jgi:hypothetical protein
MSTNKNTFILPPEPDFMVQVRSEKTGIRHFRTFAEASSAVHIDRSIWKISFPLSTGERLRLVKHSPNWFARIFMGIRDTWVYEEI